MANRKRITDSISNLMNGGTAVIETNDHQTTKQVNHHSTQSKAVNNKGIKLPKNKNYQQDSNSEVVEGPKEKATFNLSLSTLEQLEDAWILLKRKLKGEHKITKTLIVERSIELALNDLNSKGDKGELFRRLLD